MLASAVFDQEHCAATSEAVLVLIDFQTRPSTELPSSLRARLSDYL
jgi:acyl-CoA thioesterase FadM